ncbi:putative C6 transcription factor [Rosellinia necatrix]|uniref:Putative C6 transcription factor n=1 Tax=Rosellinia necatrix TaxID=77044 RepID=A0A1W2TTM1_ROSNE|nr:putative C6 transcription factor [Rosellinia necatrix]
MATVIFDSSNPSPILQSDTGRAAPIPVQHADATAASPHHKSGTPKPGSPGPEHETYRLMEKGEWLQFCRDIGILKDEESEEIVRTTGRVWPPTGFRDGLYRDVLYQKTKYAYYYHLLSITAWGLMLLQLILGAILTALGATASSNGTPITILAAVNTSVAGILALLHNSGLPDRYRWDRDEFVKLEMHIRAIADTGLVPARQSVNDAIAECFDMLATALRTVQKNTPSMYSPATSARPPSLPASPLAPAPAHARVLHKSDSEK